MFTYSFKPIISHIRYINKCDLLLLLTTLLGSWLWSSSSFSPSFLFRLMLQMQPAKDYQYVERREGENNHQPPGLCQVKISSLSLPLPLIFFFVPSLSLSLSLSLSFFLSLILSYVSLSLSHFLFLFLTLFILIYLSLPYSLSAFLSLYLSHLLFSMLTPTPSLSFLFLSIS
jgi:hypothetical protein